MMYNSTNSMQQKQHIMDLQRRQKEVEQGTCSSNNNNNGNGEGTASMRQPNNSNNNNSNNNTTKKDARTPESRAAKLEEGQRGPPPAWQKQAAALAAAAAHGGAAACTNSIGTTTTTTSTSTTTTTSTTTNATATEDLEDAFDENCEEIDDFNIADAGDPTRLHQQHYQESDDDEDDSNSSGSDSDSGSESNSESGSDSEDRGSENQNAGVSGGAREIAKVASKNSKGQQQQPQQQHKVGEGSNAAAAAEECSEQEAQEDSQEDDDDGDDDDSSDDGESRTSRVSSSSMDDSSEWSSDGDYDEYEDLMKEMPIALGPRRVPPPAGAGPGAGAGGRVGGVTPPNHNRANLQASVLSAMTTAAAASTAAAATSASSSTSNSAKLPVPVRRNLPSQPSLRALSGVATATAAAGARGRPQPSTTTGALPVPAITTGAGAGMMMMANPLEGLAMLQNIRAELEQVGRMIVAKKDGEKFLQRAHILASINWLSRSLPSCVLDHLGQEIRESLQQKEAAAAAANVAAQQNPKMSLKRVQTATGGLAQLLATHSANNDNDNNNTNNALMEHVHVVEDMSEASDLSEHHLLSDSDEDDSITNTSSYGDLMDFELGENDDNAMAGTAADGAMDRMLTSFLHRRSSSTGVSVSWMPGSPTKSSSHQQHQTPSNRSRATLSREMSEGLTEAGKILSPVWMKSPIRLPRSAIAASSSTLTSSPSKRKPSSGVMVEMLPTANEEEASASSASSAADVMTSESSSPRFRRGAVGSSTRALMPLPDDLLQSQHPPVTVVESRFRKKDTNLPAVSYFQGALLFVDISGFTSLSTKLDPENLSKVINSYFQLLVDKVFEYDGDIQKFAGDALFAEWRSSPTVALEVCVEAAAACALALAKDCANFPVMAFGCGMNLPTDTSAGGSSISSLNVHCGLGVGEMAGIHVGDNQRRREYLYLGDPITQATSACDFASLGEVVASKRVYDMLRQSGAVDDLYSVESAGNGNDRGAKVVHGPTNSSKMMIQRFDSTSDYSSVAGELDEKDFVKLTLAAFKSKYDRSHVRNAKSRGVTDHVDGLQVDALIEYRRLMSLYVHPVVVANDVAASDDFKSRRATACKSNSNALERHREEAELRSAYCMFINPIVPVDLTGDRLRDMEAAEKLNSIINLVTKELDRYNGHLRQFIVDDKCLVLIATFGLRGSTFPNMVAEKALPATMGIHHSLQNELGVESRIGCAFGDVYCGAVGGDKRHEYAVMGPSVNLAARLMCSPINPGILVDNAVRKMASRSYGFNALDPVKAKGYKDPVPIFEPLSPVERTWGKLVPNFAGRRVELTKVITLTRSMLRMKLSPPKVIMVTSSSGMGKTTFLAHAIEQIRKLMGIAGRQMLIARHVSKESDALTPFGTVKQILLKVLSNYRSSSDEKSIHSGMSSCFTSLNQSTAYESISADSHGSSTCLSVTQSADLLTAICKEVDASQEFIDYVKYTFLGLEEGTSKIMKKIDIAPPNKLLVEFFTHAFLRCTQDAKLAVLALDDVHHADEMSWHVIRTIFEEGENTLIIGACCSLSSNMLHVPENFWKNLNTEHAANGRFQTLELGRLDKEDITTMVIKTLGIQRKDVNPELLDEVFVQSGGMPHFANKILEGIKQRSTFGHGNLSGDDDYDSMGEIILHRIDGFDISVRNVLNVSAILGENFTLGELITILKESSDAKDEHLREETASALQEAVKEGILFTESKEEFLAAEITDAAQNNDRSFKFYNQVWHSTLLGLMLESRKRDVHRKIAQSMENRLASGPVSMDFKKNLFTHWKGSGDTMKATSTALALGKRLENELNSPDQAVTLYRETLIMWGWDKTKPNTIGGISSEVLNFVSAPDLSNIITLMVAMGRALALCSFHSDSVSTYEDALRILQASKAAPKLKDRSIVFPAFIGLSKAIKAGHLEQDSSCRYEQAMLRRFLQETRIHGRLIHHIHALYLQIDLYARQEELDKAIAVQSVIKNLYKVDRHSRGLRNVYGQDSGALSFSLAALWHMVQGDNKQALRTCRHVLKELLPKIEAELQQSFAMIYPIILVLKETGYSTEARGFLEKVVVGPFAEQLRKPENVHLRKVIGPLAILLDLSGKKEIPEAKFKSYLAWASDPANLVMGSYVNKFAGRLGRCGDSISAEICTLLAERLPDGMPKNNLISQANQMATQAMNFNRQNGFKAAQKQVQNILSKLRVLLCETHYLF